MSDDREVRATISFFAFFRHHIYVEGQVTAVGHEVKAFQLELPDRRTVEPTDCSIEELPTAHGGRGAGVAYRFSVRFPLDTPVVVDAARARLVVTRGHGLRAVIDRLNHKLDEDPVHRLYPQFQELVAAMDEPNVVEIGSRARSANLYRDWLPAGATYTGIDVVDGPNVNIVGDVHTLSAFVSEASVDAIFGISTIEHVAMPWKAALEMNKVLKPGGVLFLATHQTWPVHDEPWDFWRFSQYTWPTLFNEATGFEIVDAVMGDRGSVVAHFMAPATAGLDHEPASLQSGVIARKIGESRLSWDVDVNSITNASYPSGVTEPTA